MAYTINRTDGTTIKTLSDGTTDATTTSMTLIGKNYAGYGEFLNENFIKLLENSSNTSAPTAPMTGQLWFDNTNKLIKVYNGTTWKNLGAATASASTPTSNVTGDLWFDTANSQLKVYDGSSFIVIGPSYSSGTGTSGAIVDTVTDNVAVDHVVVKLFVNDTIVGMVSKDATFTPAVAITGFATVKPGIQLSSTVSNAAFQGQATDSQLLDGLDSTDFLRATANDTTTGTLGVLNDTGLSVGADSDFNVSVSGSDVTVKNITSDGDIIFKVNDGGVSTNVLIFDGATSSVQPGVAGTTNMGTAGTRFNVVYATEFNGTATSAEYADLAERFAADEVYDAGTVVEIGGAKEITKSVEDLSENVFGVISTRAAYLMNAAAGSNDTHPPVAVNGRVPVKVIGTVSKGDRLVSAGNGFARSARVGEVTPHNIIGKALEDKTTSGEGVVEAIVKINF